MGGHSYALHRRASPPRGVPPAPWGQATPGFWPGMGILWCTGMAQADADAGLAQEWPRESDASAKEAQVGQPGREDPPEWEMPAGLYHVGVVARHLDKGIETKRNEFAIRTK